jgi:hypothetical protein
VWVLHLQTWKQISQQVRMWQAWAKFHLACPEHLLAEHLVVNPEPQWHRLLKVAHLHKYSYDFE